MIQIDMEMPKSCFGCPLQDIQKNFACSAIREFTNTSGYTDKRPEWCPLKDSNEKPCSKLGQLKRIFDDYEKYMHNDPCAVIVTEHTLQSMRNEVSELHGFAIDPSSVLPRFYGAYVATVNDYEVALTTGSGNVVKYLLDEGREVE